MMRECRDGGPNNQWECWVVDGRMEEMLGWMMQVGFYFFSPFNNLVMDE
jgi:hypothetical protein